MTIPPKQNARWFVTNVQQALTMTDVKAEIKTYLAGQPEAKRAELEVLDRMIRNVMPKAKLWFLNGKDDSGKTLTNPNIGYGATTIRYANGKTNEFYQIGISANKSGLSVFIMGLEDRKYLPKTYGKTIGKADVSGYCIKFRSIKDIDLKVLEHAVRYRMERN